MQGLVTGSIENEILQALQKRGPSTAGELVKYLELEDHELGCILSLLQANSKIYCYHERTINKGERVFWYVNNVSNEVLVYWLAKRGFEQASEQARRISALPLNLKKSVGLPTEELVVDDIPSLMEYYAQINVFLPPVRDFRDSQPVTFLDSRIVSNNYSLWKEITKDDQFDVVSTSYELEMKNFVFFRTFCQSWKGFDLKEFFFRETNDYFTSFFWKEPDIISRKQWYIDRFRRIEEQTGKPFTDMINAKDYQGSVTIAVDLFFEVHDWLQSFCRKNSLDFAGFVSKEINQYFSSLINHNLPVYSGRVRKLARDNNLQVLLAKIERTDETRRLFP
ncbi:MAG: hypothetical protein ACFFD4_35220 [Candidatus Odinarchaeota archaeon]